MASVRPSVVQQSPGGNTLRNAAAAEDLAEAARKKQLDAEAAAEVANADALAAAHKREAEETNAAAALAAAGGGGLRPAQYPTTPAPTPVHPAQPQVIYMPAPAQSRTGWIVAAAILAVFLFSLLVALAWLKTDRSELSPVAATANSALTEAKVAGNTAAAAKDKAEKAKTLASAADAKATAAQAAASSAVQTADSAKAIARKARATANSAATKVSQTDAGNSSNSAVAIALAMLARSQPQAVATATITTSDPAPAQAVGVLPVVTECAWIHPQVKDDQSSAGTLAGKRFDKPASFNGSCLDFVEQTRKSYGFKSSRKISGS